MRISWIEVNLDGLSRNISALREALPSQTAIIFVVKANAYGHGLTQVAQAAWTSGIRWFAVAHLFEAIELRRVVPDARILVMGVVCPDDVPLLLEQEITPIVVGADHGLALAEAAQRSDGVLRAHLKVDTGMGRLGVDWSIAVETFSALHQRPGLKLEGVCSHFASVEPRRTGPAEEQMERFRTVTREMEALQGMPLFKHISSSRAILCRPEWDLDGVRPGICLYGYGTDNPDMRFKSQPFLQWKTRVMQVKQVPAGFPVGYYGTYVTTAPTRMAVLGVGYADGYHRALSNRGHVVIQGLRCPVIGRVSMNWVAVDVGLETPVEAGDEVVLIGERDGESVWAGELARICRTIPYEILVGIDRTAERRYISGASTSPPSPK